VPPICSLKGTLVGSRGPRPTNSVDTNSIHEITPKKKITFPNSPPEHDIKYLYWTITKMLSWNIFTCKGTYMTDWVGRASFVYTCLCLFLHIKSPVRECRSIRSGASGLPYYCAPLVCVSEVIELLTVRCHNKPKTNNQKPTTVFWAQVELDKSQLDKLRFPNWLVTSPPASLQITWPLTACQIKLSSQLESWPP